MTSDLTKVVTKGERGPKMIWIPYVRKALCCNSYLKGGCISRFLSMFVDTALTGSSDLANVLWDHMSNSQLKQRVLNTQVAQNRLLFESFESYA